MYNYKVQRAVFNWYLYNTCIHRPIFIRMYKENRNTLQTCREYISEGGYNMDIYLKIRKDLRLKSKLKFDCS